MASRLGVLGAGAPQAGLWLPRQEQGRGTGGNPGIKWREDTSHHTPIVLKTTHALHSTPVTHSLSSGAASLSLPSQPCALPFGKDKGRGKGRLEVSASVEFTQSSNFTTSAAAVSPLATAPAVAPEQAPPEAPHGTQHRAPPFTNTSSSTSTREGQGNPSTSTRTSTSTSTSTTSTGQPVILQGNRSSPSSAPPLAYELIQGPLVRWSLPGQGAASSAYAAPPTAVFLHGILGSRKNWVSFAKRMARDFPAWQMLLVDLRCHGDSSLSPSSSGGAGAEGGVRRRGPHSVASAARDVLQLVRHLRLVPRVLVGHSFGGKVALSMVDQAAKPLAKPVQVWVLDATPGEVRAGGDGEDHPRELIEALAAMRGPITDRKQVVAALRAQGFSLPVAQWMTTNLRPSGAPGEGTGTGGGGSLEWIFELEGIAEMYRSYEDTDLWPMVESVPEGVRIEFLRAERSLHRWAPGDVQRIGGAELRASAEGAGVRMHVLEDAGHWVHTDNPDGLFRILAPSFM